MAKLSAVVLAAGMGTRMKSALVKVMHPLAGAPMIAWPVAAAFEAGVDAAVLVVGHQQEKVRGYFAQGEKEVSFAVQAEQLGTGHAVRCAMPHLSAGTDTVLILCGDTPLLTAATLGAMVKVHEASGATLTVMTARFANPFGYGRVLKGDDGSVTAIVEEKDASDEERRIQEVNAGVYCVDRAFLAEAVEKLDANNAQAEYYLTDVIKQAVGQGRKCLSYTVADPAEISGVNDRVQLAESARILRGRINRELMVSGVTMIDPAAVYIDRGVTIGRDTVIHPGVTITGQTVIGEGCEIGQGAVISASRIGDGSVIKAGSVIEEGHLHEEVQIGPMAHLRPGCELMAKVKIGNFVETKKIVMGKGSKASHLTYLGDATIGTGVNIGCGTITCNYDGVKKHHTTIEDDVFVGSDVQLVAPVKVGRNSLIAAGTTVTIDVPPDSLAISRTPQVNKEGWKLRKGKG
ncbi:bifunctional UDP-N-acetylglucosamine diphosphorylase/glucosamine-1-phosphate N-acetyltransferase GlmU [Geomonas sp. Red32]|uniref:bifunctional UDP-N-acetylglucosamine diphosphorylase/glucosamine-1-phosphate N-acetyltransferase GlmU n=1 Tax=Geomonas sp. Red32 TaxID=2912856 RepID=UPI00202CCFFD|nr:bifunctional UDP-N-acetylglucosamine diphosphorylase/glucosamine-1-phosphate N-acetyltransferase GlmU [Geomonas sp. Red32]MCM0081012.1 bifunctional UDP-N-acetylglucosamine diphosphorylase/glucosamine-1-phosphate N-acetyltransferase GlmU [Geomonas sp. Red32]